MKVITARAMGEDNSSLALVNPLVLDINLEAQKQDELNKDIVVNELNVVINDETLSQKANKVLERLCSYVSIIEDWGEVFSRVDYIPESTPKIPIKVYKLCVVNELIKYASLNGCYIAKDVGSIYIYNDEFWVKIEDDTLKEFLKSIAIKLGVPRHISTDVAFAKDLFAQTLHASFFSDKEEIEDTLLNVKNGTICINSDKVKLVDFNYKHFLMHQLSLNYDTEAKNELWLNFLIKVLPSENSRKTLQQALGSLLVRKVKLEKVIFLYGTGSNGKSVIFEVLNGILGEDNISNYSISALTDNKGYHRANIKNKLINYGTDINMSDIDAGVFKTLASGEPVEARVIYKEPFIMRNYAKLIFNLNSIDDADIENTHGFFRRILFVPFEVTIDKLEQDKMLPKKILENKEGVMNWLLDGAKEVLKNKEIYESEESLLFTEKFSNVQNSVRMFITGTEIRIASNGKLSHSVLYKRYQLFCKKNNKLPLTKILFSKEMKTNGFDNIRSGEGYIWRISISK